MAQKKRRRGRDALANVQKYFPHVVDVTDSRIGLTVLVSAKDGKYATPGNPSRCALARARRRARAADGAIIGLTYSYVIRGKQAKRYKTSEGVSREIVSFDRHKDFAPGSYRLSPVAQSNALGVNRGKSTRPGTNSSTPKPHVHHTVRVRSL